MINTISDFVMELHYNVEPSFLIGGLILAIPLILIAVQAIFTRR
jgi:hypothetical protein